MNIALKIQKALGYASERTLERLHRLATHLRSCCEIEGRRREVSKLGPVSDFVDDRQKPMRRQVFDPKPDWSGRKVENIEMPGMISEEEIQYYHYLAGFYTGAGEVVELGPWLGKSTRHLVAALRANPSFNGKQLHVYDDFVWRPGWMEPCTPAYLHLERHADFLPSFKTFTGEIENYLKVTKCQFTPYDGNKHLPPFVWNDGPIEMIFADCGRTIEANESWFRVVKNSLMPGRSLLVLQDWATHREVPFKPYNQIHFFVGMHAQEFEIVHELKHGGVATFLYKG